MALISIGDDGGVPVIRGIVAKTGVDADGQTYDRKWLASSLLAWFDGGATVTTNFDSVPVGHCRHLFTDDGGESFQVDVTVYDGKTARAIESETLKGLSIGIANVHIDVSDLTRGPHGTITGGKITRVSFIDHDFWGDSAC